MLPADVYSRFMRMTGEEVLFICATDEHGTPAELAALAAGLPVAEYCAREHEVQKQLGERWQLSFDHFGRSSSAQNAELTRHFARVLKENGYIEERSTTQAYSLTDKRFLPDRYVTGTCPHCDYKAARGDQCENCTRVLDPVDLVEPRSVISGSTDIEFRDSSHLFLLQSRLADDLRKWVMSKETWNSVARSIALKWLDEGLIDRGITRDLEWGVKVPEEWPGFENKVFYVWFDAPIEYIGATKEWADQDPENRDWKSWWYDAADVEYSQFMGKDNVPFHTITFPATLLASGEPWTKVDKLKGLNYLTYYGGKFSTSQQHGVFMHDALDILPADLWRYVLMANAPETSDSDFSWDLLATAINKDLAGTLGNFVNRILKLNHNNFGDVVPSGGQPGEAEEAIADELANAVAEVTTHHKDQQFRKAMAATRNAWSLGNIYLDRVAPWKTIKVDREQAAMQMRTAIGFIEMFAVLAAPVMPELAEKMAATVGKGAAHGSPLQWPEQDSSALKDALRNGIGEGTAIAVPDILIPRVEDDQLLAWKSRFGAQAL